MGRVSAYPQLLGRLILLTQLLEPVLLFLPQVRVPLLLGLVEPVDDDVFPLGDHETLDLCDVSGFLVLKGGSGLPFCCP